MTFGDKVLAFNGSLKIRFPLPRGVTALNPFTDASAVESCRAFYGKYYNDRDKRIFVFGINPGRRGAGITGIPFTDPVQLESACRIANPFQAVPELSSTFVYRVIDRYGGAASFYRKFYITAVFPLGFMRQGKNLNYYDDRKLLDASRDSSIRYIEQQLLFGSYRETCFCLGTGKNLKILEKLNDTRGWFKKIVPLPHPRWVMQYRRRQLDEFTSVYVDTLKATP